MTGVTLVPGTNTIRAYAVDAGGNRSLTNSVVMTYTKPSALVANRGTPATIAKSAVTPNPPLQFGSISVADAVVVIESSTDLVHWTAIQTNTMVGEEITVTVPMSQLPSQFIRARTQ